MTVSPRLPTCASHANPMLGDADNEGDDDNEGGDDDDNEGGDGKLICLSCDSPANRALDDDDDMDDETAS